MELSGVSGYRDTNLGILAPSQVESAYSSHNECLAVCDARNEVAAEACPMSFIVVERLLNLSAI